MNVQHYPDPSRTTSPEAHRVSIHRKIRMIAVKETIGIARSANGNPKRLAQSQQKRSTMEVRHPNNTPTKNVRQRLGGRSKKQTRKTNIAPIIRMAARQETREFAWRLVRRCTCLEMVDDQTEYNHLSHEERPNSIRKNVSRTQGALCVPPKQAS